jgi:hypothetical protein
MAGEPKHEHSLAATPSIRGASSDDARVAFGD